MVDSVVEDSIAKDATLPNVVRTIATIEGRSSEYYTSQEAIDTARAVQRMANGTATKTDYALIERSEGARTVILSAEGTKAWDSLKAVAQKDADARIDMKASKSGIGIKKSVREYPYDMKKVISDYIDSTNEEFKSFIKSVSADKNTPQNKKYLFGNVAERTSKIIEKITGINVEGFKTAIESRMIWHIEKDHGVNGKTDKSMSNIDDLARIEYVLNNYDDIVYGGTTKSYTTVKENGRTKLADTVVYSKKINGTYYVVQAVPNAKAKTLYVVSAYISKKGAAQLTDADNAPVLTSEDGSVVTPNDSISKDKATVNSKDMRSESSSGSTSHLPLHKGGLDVRSESPETSGVKYRIGVTNKNNKVVMLEEDIFEGKEGKKHDIVADYITKQLGESFKIAESGQSVYIGEDLPNEFTQSEYTKKLLKNKERFLKAKNRTVQNFGEIIEIATDRKWEKAKHAKKHSLDAKYGFYKYTSRIAVPKYDSNKNIVDSYLYDIELVIRNDADGKKYLYDIQNIQEIKKSDEQLSSTWKAKLDRSRPSPSTDSISKDKATVNSKDMHDGEIYSGGKRVSFEKGERVGGNVVYNEGSRKFAKKNREGYKVIQTMAKDLGMKVKFVKGLVDGDGNVLDGVITSEGIFINTEAENPVRWAATHEFSHRMKQTGGKAWQKYQDYVIKHLKETGKYQAMYDAKKGAYAENEIDEEIAADYIGEMFSDVKELAEFIRESRQTAFSVRNMWYKVLDALGLSDEKKKAQRMWAGAYREAMKNTDKVQNAEYGMRSDATSSTAKAVPLPLEGEGSGGVKYSIAQNSKGKYVKASRQVIKGNNPKEWAGQVERYINDSIRKNKDVMFAGADGNLFVITTDTAGKARFRNVVDENGKKRRMTDSEYATKLRAETHIDELIQTSKTGKSRDDSKAHSFAKDGFNYRKAYFEDFDGEYYEVTISVGKNGIVNTVYNVGRLDKRTNPSYSGSKTNQKYSDHEGFVDKTRVAQKEPSVNSKDMQNVEKDARAEKKVPSPEEAKRAKNVDNGIVVSEESKKLKKENLRAYNNIGKLATSLNTRAVVVSGLKNSEGKALAGQLKDGVIYVNADVGADKISRWAALHEASHLIKQKAAKIWQRFENYAIKRLEDTGEYKVKYELKKDDYKAAEINEELACDYIGELFESEAELTEFIRTDKSLAVKIRDGFFNALSRWGLFGERKKAQALWLKAYKAAMKKSDAKSEQNKFKIITMSDGSGRKYVHATQRVIKSKNPDMWESEIIDYVNKTVRKGNDVVIPFDNEESITITGRTAWKLGDRGTMPEKYYLVKGNAAGVIDEIIAVSNSYKSKAPYKEHSDDFAKYGFDYRKAYLMDVDGKYYELAISVGINLEDKEAYNIGYVKRTTFPVTGSKARSTKLYGKSSSTPMVSQDKPGVKNNSMQNDGNYDKESVLGTRLSETEAKEDRSLTARLLEENARLREHLEDIHIQLNQAEGKGLDTKAIKKAAEDIKKSYSSKIKIGQLHSDLVKLYTYMAKNEVDGEEVARRISDIATKVIDDATETIELSEYSDLLKTIRETKLTVPEDDRESFSEGYEHFRKINMGRIVLGNHGYHLDAFWDDLCSEYPELFFEEIQGSEERLNRIIEVKKMIKPYESSVYTEEEAEKVKICLENDIMDSFFKIPEGGDNKYVFYDKRAAQAQKALEKAEERHKKELEKTVKRLEGKIEKMGKAAQKAEEKVTKMRDKRDRDKVSNSINRVFGYLFNMAENPTDARHIPEKIKKDVQGFVNRFIYETKTVGKKETKEEKVLVSVRLDQIGSAYEKILRTAWESDLNESPLLDERLSEAFSELMEEIPEDPSGNFKKLEDMTTRELALISDMLTGIHYAITQSNKLFSENMKATKSEASENVDREMDDTRSKRKGNGERWVYSGERGIHQAYNRLNKFMTADMLQPWDLFHKIGGTMENLFGEARKAFNKHIENLQKTKKVIKKAVGKLEIREMTGNKQKDYTFELLGGEKIKLFKGQILSLYAI